MTSLAKKFIVIALLALSITRAAHAHTTAYEDEFSPQSDSKVPALFYYDVCEESSPYLLSICLPQEKLQPDPSILSSVWQSLTVGASLGVATHIVHNHYAHPTFAALYGTYTYWDDIKTTLHTKTIADVAYSIPYWIYAYGGYALITYVSSCLIHNGIHFAAELISHIPTYIDGFTP